MTGTPSFLDIHDNMLEPDVCKEIIRRFEEDKENQFEGVVGDTDGRQNLNPSHKSCTELSLSYLAHWKDIDQIIYEAVVEGLSRTAKKYEGLHLIEGKLLDEGYRIKKYRPGGEDFFNIHVDCNGFAHSHRQLVLFMYLNTVAEGGETEFPAQGVLVKPVEGRMVTFPPFWTHAHIGRPPVSEAKYAVTAWITFPRVNRGLNAMGQRVG